MYNCSFTTNFSLRITAFYFKDSGLSVRGPSRGEPKLGSWANARVIRLWWHSETSQKQVFRKGSRKGGENPRGFRSQQAIRALYIQAVHDGFFVKGKFHLHQSLPRLRFEWSRGRETHDPKHSGHCQANFSRHLTNMEFFPGALFLEGSSRHVVGHLPT